MNPSVELRNFKGRDQFEFEIVIGEGTQTANNNQHQKRVRMPNAFTTQILAQGYPRFHQHFFSGVKQSFVEVGESVKKLVQQVFEVDAVGVRALAAVIAVMPAELIFAVFALYRMVTHLDREDNKMSGSNKYSYFVYVRKR